jgi:hypothetical protein
VDIQKFIIGKLGVKFEGVPVFLCNPVVLIRDPRFYHILFVAGEPFFVFVSTSKGFLCFVSSTILVFFFKGR